MEEWSVFCYGDPNDPEPTGTPPVLSIILSLNQVKYRYLASNPNT